MLEIKNSARLWLSVRPYFIQSIIRPEHSASPGGLNKKCLRLLIFDAQVCQLPAESWWTGITTSAGFIRFWWWPPLLSSSNSTVWRCGDWRLGVRAQTRKHIGWRKPSHWVKSDDCTVALLYKLTRKLHLWWTNKKKKKKRNFAQTPTQSSLG